MVQAVSAWETLRRSRLGHSFSKPSRYDYGYRIYAHTERRHYRWTVKLNDASDPHGNDRLATGTAYTVSLAERNAELAVRGLPRICDSWPDGYAPMALDEWQKAAWGRE